MAVILLHHTHCCPGKLSQSNFRSRKTSLLDGCMSCLSHAFFTPLIRSSLSYTHPSLLSLELVKNSTHFLKLDQRANDSTFWFSLGSLDILSWCYQKGYAKQPERICQAWFHFVTVKILKASGKGTRREKIQRGRRLEGITYLSQVPSLIKFG